MFLAVIRKRLFVFLAVIRKRLFMFLAVIRKRLFVFLAVIRKRLFMFLAVIRKRLFVFLAVIRKRLFPHGHEQEDRILGQDWSGLGCDWTGKSCHSGFIKTPRMKIFSSEFTNIQVVSEVGLGNIVQHFWLYYYV